MRTKKVTVANAFPPLTKEEFIKVRTLPYSVEYERLREYPLGKTVIGVKELRAKVFHHSHPTAVLTIFLRDMEQQGMLHLETAPDEKGNLAYMHITVHDQDSIPEHLSKVSPGTPNSGDGLNIFLRNFAMLYRQQTNCEWPRTAKEVGMAKHVLAKKFGNDHAKMVKFAHRFFNMPLEQMPDDVSFTSFSFMVDKLLALDLSETRWERAKAVGEQAAAARAVPPTEEEDAEWHRKARIQIEENKRARAEEAAWRAAHNEED